MSLTDLAHAQVRGLIVGPGAERHRMAVSPLKNIGAGEDGRNLATEMADVMAEDLNRSGWFQVIDRSAYIENAQNSGVAPGTFDFADWSTIGAEGLIKGAFETQGNAISVELRLYDVFQQKQIVGKQYSGEVRDARRIAHRFVDEIIFQFTGTRGVFDSRIAYVSTGGERFKEIYVTHLDGSEVTKITNNRTINLFPAWSPDSRSVLYTSYKNGRPQVFSYDLFTAQEKPFSTQEGLNLGGDWAPDGQSVALALEKAGNIDLYLVDTAGNVMQRLTENAAIDVSPSWAPDGKRLAFVSDRSGAPQVYIMDIASRNVTRLTYSGNYNTSPDWSPRGDQIAFTGMAGGNFDIFTIGVDGKDVRKITANPADDEDPSWAPDGRFIAFTSSRTGSHRIYTMRANGENQQRLTGSSGDDTNPSWSPRLQQ